MEEGKAVFEEGILEDENRLFDVIIKGRNQDVRKILSTGMVYVDCVEPKSGRTPLALKINLLPKNKRAGKRFKDVVQLLLDAGADPRKADKDGDTPLIIASLCKYDQREVVQLLLHRGADPNKADKYGHTPLCMAAYNGHKDVALLLLDSGADPNKTDDDGWSSLHWAVETGEKDVVQLLLNKGADPNKTDIWGRTPLAQVVFFGRTYGDIENLLQAAMTSSAHTN